MEGKLLAAEQAETQGGSVRAFEVDESEVQEKTRPGRSRGGRIFPVNLCFCAPFMQRILPSTCYKIQDWTHLALILGLIASGAIVIDSVFAFWHNSFKCRAVFCAYEVVAVLFTLPCTMYLIRTIGQYNEQLQNKQQEAKIQKEQLTKTYIDYVEDMEELLGRSAESSAGLAEQSFESKRRDFVRFIERVKSKYSQLFTGTNKESEELVQEFKRFVLNWMRVFEECSIDPVNCPKQLVMQSELERCATVEDVCQLALSRLRATEVRFISVQREQDADLLTRRKSDLHRISITSQPKAIEDIPLQPVPSGPESSKIVNTDCGRRGSTQYATALRTGNWKSWQLSWMNFGCRCGCSYQSSDWDEVDGYFPREWSCCCCTFTILSPDHLMLLLGFLGSWVLLGLELFHVRKKSVASISEILMTSACLGVVITKFEEVDVIQQLEKEVRELKKAAEQVEKQREEMHEFWSNAQQLTELWLYRTVPRLDLYKEVQCHLEDAQPEKLLPYMALGNEMLEAVEANLGELEDWRVDGHYTLDKKKNFKEVINKVCLIQDKDQQLTTLAQTLQQGAILDEKSQTTAQIQQVIKSGQAGHGVRSKSPGLGGRIGPAGISGMNKW